MKTFLITILLLSGLMAEQNSSTAFGTKIKLQDTFKTFKQNDGSTFEGVTRGKDFFTYIELSNGYICLYNKETNIYEYALIQNGKLVLSGISVTANGIPENIKQISQQDLEKLQEDAFKKHL